MFEVVTTDGAARAGVLHLPHGYVPTPVFMPVGTQATVKTLTPADLHELGAGIILSNTYHLYLRPGAELIARLGGLHKFMGWDRPILTDSGGFQVFSLGPLRTITDEGVTFKSHIDGSTHLFTPERVMKIEELLGADIAMAFDECATATADYDYHREAVERTTRWAERCRKAHTRSDQYLFGIVQGGVYPNLRAQSAKEIVAFDFPGYAIGGLSVGESKAEMYSTLEAVTPLLPSNKPRYLMGVGSPEDLFEAVARGVDMMDCVLPTRVARNGALLTSTGRLNIKNARFREMDAPIDPTCGCPTCRTFSAAYLHHLFRAEELLAYRLATVHNLYFMLSIMRRIRAAIVEGRFAALHAEFKETYRTVDEEMRLSQNEARQRRRNAEVEWDLTPNPLP